MGSSKVVVVRTWHHLKLSARCGGWTAMLHCQGPSSKGAVVCVCVCVCVCVFFFFFLLGGG